LIVIGIRYHWSYDWRWIRWYRTFSRKTSDFINKSCTATALTIDYLEILFALTLIGQCIEKLATDAAAWKEILCFYSGLILFSVEYRYSKFLVFDSCRFVVRRAKLCCMDYLVS
jgi:hypothetical protein